MKKIAVILLAMFFLNPVFSQSNKPTASYSSDTGIKLNTQFPLAGTYEVNITNMGWTSTQAQQAANYLDSKSNLISITVDFPAKKFLINLDLTNPLANGWGISEWNAHLAIVR